ncbi:unnamed protein product [Meloidogyne enterolobii]|uniref:Uncharacterized protein n=1 Tax=Meloidogyne enterolobii TaxID=390850 RepID=A0ACB0Z0N2_MELEN
MSGHPIHRSRSSPMIAWNSHSRLARTYSVSDISAYTNASDYFKQRWSTAYNPYHNSRTYYYWPHHRSSSLYPVYSTHESTRYFYESPYYTRVPTFYPTWDFNSNSNYYTYLLARHCSRCLASSPLWLWKFLYIQNILALERKYSLSPTASLLKN